MRGLRGTSGSKASYKFIMTESIKCLHRGRNTFINTGCMSKGASFIFESAISFLGRPVSTYPTIYYTFPCILELRALVAESLK
jgi:hypothetical protein